MVTGSSLLALAMAAASGTGPAEVPISCQVRVLTIDGLGWRSDYYARLQPVARQGTSAIWTADRALAETLTVRALTATVAPVCTNPGETTVDLKATTCYVEHMERLADGPINGASAVAWKPETASVEEGFRASVSGRKLDQGVLARVAIEESHVKTMHVVKMAETVPTVASPAAAASPSTGEILGRFVEAVQMKLGGEVRNLGIVGDDRAHSLVVETRTLDQPGRRVAVQVQVPEVSHVKVAGEWLVPNNGVLLVSLGVDTVADDQGKAVVRERIALLEVAPAADSMAMTQPHFENGRPWPAPAPRPAMPATPTRSMPIAVDPRGKVVDLPPIPESISSAELDQIRPAPDQPSPQAIHASSTSRAGDMQVARTGLEAPIEFARTAAGSVAGPSMPAIPARSLPVAVDPNGQVVDLPPLPEAVASADLNRIAPEPGQPSGQARHIVSEPVRDSRLAQARFEPLEPVEPRVDPRAVAGAVGTVTGVDDGSTPVDPAHAPCSAGPPMATIPTLFAQLVQRLSELDVDLDDNMSDPAGRDATDRGESVTPEGLACIMPGCKSCGAAAPKGPDGMTLSVFVKDPVGQPVGSTASLGSALKNPGKTETRYIPLGGKFALEVKATLVPAHSGMYKEGGKNVTGPANP